MISQVVGKNIVERDGLWLQELVNKFDRVILDLGCGDGKWTYRFAMENPQSLVIGVDSDASKLEKTSHKASRKAVKGGLENLVFIQAYGESLPSELAQQVDQIYINFPWGSLLSGVMNMQPDFLRSIATIAEPGCQLQVYTTYHSLYEPQMIEKLQLPELSSNLKDSLTAGWSEYGWNLESFEQISSDKAQQTSWWKEISQRQRDVWQIVFSRL